MGKKCRKHEMFNKCTERYIAVLRKDRLPVRFIDFDRINFYELGQRVISMQTLITPNPPCDEFV